MVQESLQLAQELLLIWKFVRRMHGQIFEKQQILGYSGGNWSKALTFNNSSTVEDRELLFFWQIGPILGYIFVLL